jgi:hypothetical protein
MKKYLCVTRYPSDWSKSSNGGDYQFITILVEKDGKWWRYEWSSAFQDFDWCWLGNFGSCGVSCSECRIADAFLLNEFKERIRPLFRITKEEAERIMIEALNITMELLDDKYIEEKIEVDDFDQEPKINKEDI